VVEKQNKNLYKSKKKNQFEKTEEKTVPKLNCVPEGVSYLLPSYIK